MVQKPKTWHPTNNVFLTNKSMPFTHFLTKTYADRAAKKKKGSMRTSTFTRRKVKRTAYGRTTRRKKMFKRVAFGGTTRRGKMATMSRRVSALTKDVKAALGELTHRRMQVGSFTASVNKSLFSHIVICNRNSIEDALSSVAMYDSATNSITQVNAASAAFQRSLEFKACVISCTIRNNRSVPCHIRGALVHPRNDTAVNPSNAYAAGLLDAGGIAVDDILVRTSDSMVYVDLWKNISGTYVDRILLPGEQVVMKTNLGAFSWEPSTVDTDDLAFRVADKPACLALQVRGTISHDAKVSTEHGFGQAGVDVSVERVYKITYAAGISIKRTILDNEAVAAFTNIATVGAAPLAGQQNFAS